MATHTCVLAPHLAMHTHMSGVAVGSLHYRQVHRYECHPLLVVEGLTPVQCFGKWPGPGGSDLTTGLVHEWIRYQRALLESCGNRKWDWVGGRRALGPCSSSFFLPHSASWQLGGGVRIFPPKRLSVMTLCPRTDLEAVHLAKRGQKRLGH